MSLLLLLASQGTTYAGPVDLFPGSSYDAVWTSVAADASVVSGRSRHLMSTGYTSEASTAFSYTLDEGLALVEVETDASGDNPDVYFYIGKSPTNRVVFERIDTLLYMVSGSTDASVAWDATAHRWWRIREESGTLYFETAPDGTTWTTRRTVAHSMDLTALRVMLGAGRNTTTGGPYYHYFDNLNSPPSVGAGQALAGQTDGTSTTTAALTVALALAGTSAGTSSTTAALTVALAVAGQADGTSTAAGTLALAAALAGQTDGTSTTTAALVLAVALAGTSTGTATATGTLGAGVELAGTAAGASTVAAALAVALALNGQTGGTSTTAAALAVGADLAGTSAGTSTAAAAFTVAYTLAGQTDGAATATAALAVALALAGQTGGTSTGAAALTNPTAYEVTASTRPDTTTAHQRPDTTTAHQRPDNTTSHNRRATTRA